MNFGALQILDFWISNAELAVESIEIEVVQVEVEEGREKE